MKDILSAFFAGIIVIVGTLGFIVSTYIDGFWQFVAINLGIFVLALPAIILWEQKIKDWLK